jgi:ankyrin repeat protein
MKEYSKSIDIEMSFTTQLLKGCVMLDIVNVVNRYLVPKNPTFKQLCSIGLVEQLLVFCLNTKQKTNNCSISLNFNLGLNYACQNGQLEIVNLMIKKGATNWNWGISGACQNGQLKIVNLMIEKGADDWNEGLYTACQGGHLEIVNLMIEKGAYDWNNGLSAAYHGRHLEIINLMIEKGGTHCNNCTNHIFN